MSRRYLIRICVLCLCLPVGPAVWSQAKAKFVFPARVFLEPGSGARFAKIQAELHRLARESPRRESAIYKRLVALSHKLKKPKPGEINSILLEYFKILLDASAIWTDPDSHGAIASALLKLAGMMETFMTPEQRARRRLGERAETFVENYHRANGNRADARRLRGAVCLRRRPLDIACMEYYLACLRIAPANENCRRSYERFTEFYSRPRCAGTEIGALRFVPLGASDAPGQKPYYRRGDEVWYRIPDLPDLVGVEILEIVSGGSRDGPRSLLTLSPGGTRKLLIITTRLASHGWPLALVRGRKVLVAPRVFSRLLTGRLVVGVPLAELCLKTRRRTVPSRYKLPGKK